MLSKKHYIVLAILITVASVVSYLVKTSSVSGQQMKVQLLWQSDPLNCLSTFAAGNNNEAWFIEQLQFFISDIEFQAENSVWQSAKLIKTPFQTYDTALLGTNCREVEQQKRAANSGNWQVEFDSNTLVSGIKRMRFTLGVPFSRNHLNPISQESPLNIPSMFWVWQTGHKFIRLELANRHTQWLFHLGSTGCQSLSVMRAPKKSCRYPNIFTFELPIPLGNSGDLILNVDLAQLLSEVELSAQTNCQSEQDVSSCQQLFNNLLFKNKHSNSNVGIREKSIFSVTKAANIDIGEGVE